MAFRSRASFGKRQEFVAIAELLRRNFDVYLTLVDDQQIDCIIRQQKGGELRYLDIQIKARSKEAKTPGLFSAMDIRNPRENFYWIFYAEEVDTHWIIPSLELVKIASQNKTGKNADKYSINLCSTTRAGVKPRSQFKAYENNFELLEWA